MTCMFSSLLLLFGAAVFSCMLSYVITDMPKDALSVAVGVAHSLCILLSLLMMFLALPVGSNNKDPKDNKPKCLQTRHNKLFKLRLMFLFHVTIGTFTISDPLFLREKNPSASTGQVGQNLYKLMIAGAAAQAFGVLTTFAVSLVTDEK
ncbi:hypothetical protein IWQ57_001381 [Coemansia nantahalensis]|nr:hypothetical protein IWQ57_001381 [Coemansia nantahalensis]